jgi:modulator of FtsH protease
MQYPYSSAPQSQPIVLSSPVLSTVYALVALAMAVTAAGVFVGGTFALPILSSGWISILFILELGVVWTAGWWVRSSPLNILLFFAFPFLSGLTVTPLLLSVVTGYVNGVAILANAAIATALMTVAAAVFGRTTSMNLSSIGSLLFFSVIGLIVAGVLQIFIPGLRGGAFELIVSGVGVVTFALFIAYDMNRIGRLSAQGYSPFLLALSLYLDIFNLFLYVLRFMLEISGKRR